MLYESLKAKKRKVILDTDIGPDCDDVGAIAVLLSYANELGFEVAGICNCTSNIYGSVTADVICRYCGYENIPMGIYSKPGFYDDESCRKYNKFIAENFSEKYRSGTFEVLPHVSFYRKLLSVAEDDSVIIVTIGMFNTMAALLESKPDKYSSLTGEELVRRKVHCAVSMAARLPNGREFNVVCDYMASKVFFEKFPHNIYVSDAALGETIMTGYKESDDMQTNPIYKSYQLYTADREVKCVNASFDLTAVQFACEGEGEIYSLTKPGRLEFYREKKFPNEDATRFVEDEAGKIYFMKKNISDEKIAQLLNSRIHVFDR